MKKSIIIIGAGMGGLASGVYGQKNGFETTIFEAHHLPGGQCTSWNRKGYTFDACLHNLNGFKEGTKVNDFWQELGAMPCELVPRREYISALFPDGTCMHNYFDTNALNEHLKKLSPEDSSLIDEYTGAIESFITEIDWFGISNFGTFFEKISTMPFVISKLKYFKYTMASFAARFKNPYLQKAFPLMRNGLPDIPLFAFLSELSSIINNDTGWPRGGGMTISKNIARYYEQLGGRIRYKKKVISIITENNRACGIQLEDGTIHKADYVISNADGRKTILNMLGGRFMNKKVAKYCTPYPEDNEVTFSVLVNLGVKRDLSSYPSSLILFLDKPEELAGIQTDHLQMQIYGFDTSMAPEGRGVIKVELTGKPSHFSKLVRDKKAYNREKNRIAGEIITILEKQFPGLTKDIEVTDVSTLHTWERFMNGTQGYNNFPRKYEKLTDIRNVLDFIFGLNKMFTLPGLKNFYFAGQWVTSMGSLFSNALTGKTVIEKICKKERVSFKSRYEPSAVLK